MTNATVRMTASDIAELAGVQRSTVSNWQRRHPDTFPQPLPDSPAGRPQFDAVAIRAWLAERQPDKPLTVSRADEVVRNWRYTTNHVQCEDGQEPLAILIAAIEGLEPRFSEGYDERYPVCIEAPDLDTRIYATKSQADVIREFLETELVDVDRNELIEAAAREYEGIGRWRRHPDAVSAEENLYKLLADLVHDETSTILDFSCGTGGLIVAASRRHPKAEYLGMEPGLVEWFIADARLNHLAGGEAEYKNILTEDALAGRTFGAVVSIPPAGVRVDPTNERMRRLPFGPVRGLADAAWPQLAVQALAPEGEAFLVLPQSLASSERADGIRRELLQQGLLSAIVTLPANALPSGKIMSHLWILSRRRKPGGDVLFVDWSMADPTDVGAYKDLSKVMYGWLDDGPFEVPDDPRFITESPVRLLGRTVNLDPLYWCAKAATPTAAPELIDAVRQATNAINVARTGFIGADVPVCPLAPDNLTMWTLGDARDQDLLQVIRRPVQSKGLAELRVKDAEAMRRGEHVEFSETPMLDVASFGDNGVVAVGDVLVWATFDRQIRTAVCTVAGPVPTSSVTVIRCTPGAIDPHYLALVLASGGNAVHITGSTIPSVRWSELSFPLVSIQHQSEIASYSDAAKRLLTASQAVASAVEEFHQALADAAGSGAVRVHHDRTREEGL